MKSRVPKNPARGGKTDDRWALQDAKARFSELVRMARSQGPQRVTIHGRDGVVIVSEADYARLKGERSGRMLVEVLAGSPLQDIEIEHAKVRGSVRDVEL